jgi:serine/threonine-protein kinase
VLFIVHTSGGPNRIDVISPSGERKMLLSLAEQSLSDVCYSTTGHILFRRAPTNPGIWALPFSTGTLEVTGEPFLVAPAGANASVSHDGTLVFMSGSSSAPRQFVWADREGRIEPIGDPDPDLSAVCAIAPDGRRIAMARTEGSNVDLWIMDAVRATSTRLTFDDRIEQWPTWTPDGESIVYHARTTAGGGGEDFRILRRRADGTGPTDTLATGWCASVSPDGQHVLFSLGLFGEANLASVSIDGGEPAVAFTEQGTQMSPAVSPTGNYVAYTSFESGGQQQIYLKRYPSWQGKWQVSIGGGDWPRWSDDGKRLFYLNKDDFFEVEVSGSVTPTLSRPTKLFTREAVGRMFPGAGLMFDVTDNGSRFIWRADVENNSADRSITVVQNWYSEFRDRE